MKNKKGLAVSLNVVIVVAMGLLTIASLSVFFFSSSFSQISEADAQRIFSSGCARYCQPDLYQTFRNAYTASQNDENFVRACERLNYGDRNHVNRCFERCANCNLDVNEGDINTGYDNLLALTERG